MEDLRNTAYAYRKVVREERGNEDEFVNFFNELDKNRDDRIYFDEFESNMNAKGHKKYGSDRDFFRKLTRGGRDYLEYCDIVTLVYIINSGRPFCNQCRYFIPGTFFTCVLCFETDGDFNYNLCPSCYYVKGKSHGHCHKEFVDSLSLLRLKAKRELSGRASGSGTSLRRPSLLTPLPPIPSDRASGSGTSLRRPSLLTPLPPIPSRQAIGLTSSSSIRKYESRPSTSSSIVIHDPRERQSRVLELMQIAAGCTTIAVAVSQLCTIM